MNPNLHRSIASLLIVSTASFTVPAHADMIGGAAPARERISATLVRAEVRAQLASHGVNPGDVEARVATLTDEEAARLAAGIDELPAGGFVPALIAAMAAAAPIAIAVVLVLPVVLVVGGVVIAARVVSSISKNAKQKTGDDAPVKAEGTSSPQN
jgi:hypothetical protein